MAHPQIMKAYGCFLLFSLFSPLLSAAYLEDAFAPGPADGVDAFSPEPTDGGDVFAPGPVDGVPDQGLDFDNPRLQRAHRALQAMKRAIYSDPNKMIDNWVGSDVCSYTGITCSSFPDDPLMMVVSGIDLTHGDIAGYLPPEIELLEELSFLHINSNRFCGVVPEGIKKLPFLSELDISNNRFVGPFPKAVLEMEGLAYLDLRYNNFEGPLPPELFEKMLDAIFLNNNRFTSTIPDTLGKSMASVIVFANNNLTGCIPNSIGDMPNVEQLLFSDNRLSGCIPEEIRHLENVTVLGLSGNNFTGDIPDSICELPMLADLNFADNYFVKAGQYCYAPTANIHLDDAGNCLAGRPNQKPEAECSPMVNMLVDGLIDCTQCKQPGGSTNQVEPFGSVPDLPISLPPASLPEASAPSEAPTMVPNDPTPMNPYQPS